MIVAIASLVAAIANGIVIIITAIKGLTKIEEIRHQTNSIVNQLVTSTAKGSLAEGVAQGRAEVHAEQQVQGALP